MNFKLTLNVLLQNQAIQKADMLLNGVSGMPQVRVGVVGQAMQLVGNHTHFCAI